MVGLASFGARAAYLGKIRDDQLGDVFAHDIRSTGVVFNSGAATEGPATGRCLIVVTPDAERTMNTFLGASAFLDPDDVDADMVAAAKVVYLEGYLWDRPGAKDAYRKAARIAHEAGNEVSLTLSDSFCVDRHRSEWRTLVADEVDILFANEGEICALYECEFEVAMEAVRKQCRVAALTRSAEGSVIVSGADTHVVAAHPVETLVDTTAAGDLYAAGFLSGYTRGDDLETCARLGSLAAAEVISHLGARPETTLSDMAALLKAR
jgi:sugar/nucleoside kinase (ribokinase family)